MKRNSQFQSSLTAACSVLLMLCAGQAGLAQQSATDKPAAAASVAPAAASTAPAAKHQAPQHPAAQTATAEKAATAPAKPGSEGIKVHGHWIIDVKNPDGSLAQHRDFENSLQDGGQFLAGLASGYMVFGGYDIALVGNACPPTALDGNTNCYIFQSGAYLNAQCSTYYACIGGLTVAANITSGQPFSIVLSGSGVVPLAGTISAVQTQDFYCYSYTGSIYVPTGANPAACTATGINGGPIVGIAGSTFTGTTLATPLAVTAGQGILVTVTISFS
jgi:hypothetical protein